MGREGGRGGEGGEGGREGGMTVIFEEQSRHVLRNNARRCLRRTTIVRNYVRREVDTRSATQIKVPELESKLVVHSSIINQLDNKPSAKDRIKGIP